MEAFGKVQTISGLPNSCSAQLMLERLAREVTKTMQRRRWHVPILCEFYPKELTLQGCNTNRGQKIQVRLRHPHNLFIFQDYDFILENLLHE